MLSQLCAKCYIILERVQFSTHSTMMLYVLSLQLVLYFLLSCFVLFLRFGYMAPRFDDIFHKLNVLNYCCWVNSSLISGFGYRLSSLFYSNLVDLRGGEASRSSSSWEFSHFGVSINLFFICFQGVSKTPLK